MNDELCNDCELQGIFVQLFCPSSGDPESLVCAVWGEFNRKLMKIKQQCLNETPEETAQYLIDNGYNLEALDKRIQAVVRKALDESPMNPKNQEEQS